MKALDQALDLAGGPPQLEFSQTLNRGDRFGLFCLLTKRPKEKIGNEPVSVYIHKD